MAIRWKRFVAYLKDRTKEGKTRENPKCVVLCWNFNNSEHKETFRGIYYSSIHNAAKIKACGPNFGPSPSKRNNSVHQCQISRDLLDSLLSFSYHLSFLSSSQQCCAVKVDAQKSYKKTPMITNMHFVLLFWFCVFQSLRCRVRRYGEIER